MVDILAFTSHCADFREQVAIDTTRAETKLREAYHAAQKTVAHQASEIKRLGEKLHAATETIVHRDATIAAMSEEIKRLETEIKDGVA
jgi:peptidoglycan hydrolase CwlO-like protein